MSNKQKEAYNKAIAVIKSCKTPDQFDIAYVYIKQYEILFDDEDTYLDLYDILMDEEVKRCRVL